MTTTTTNVRDAFVDGMREFADFLDSHPDVQAPHDEKFLLPLHTIDAVVSFAARFSRAEDVRIEDDGAAFFELSFGPIVYQAYGYADFDDYCKRMYESRARDWAAKQHGPDPGRDVRRGCAMSLNTMRREVSWALWRGTDRIAQATEDRRHVRLAGMWWWHHGVGRGSFAAGAAAAVVIAGRPLRVWPRPSPSRWRCGGQPGRRGDSRHRVLRRPARWRRLPVLHHRRQRRRRRTGRRNAAAWPGRTGGLPGAVAADPLPRDLRRLRGAGVGDPCDPRGAQVNPGHPTGLPITLNRSQSWGFVPGTKIFGPAVTNRPGRRREGDEGRSSTRRSFR